MQIWEHPSSLTQVDGRRAGEVKLTSQTSLLIDCSIKLGENEVRIGN